MKDEKMGAVTEVEWNRSEEERGSGFKKEEARVESSGEVKFNVIKIFLCTLFLGCHLY